MNPLRLSFTVALLVTACSMGNPPAPTATPVPSPTRLIRQTHLPLQTVEPLQPLGAGAPNASTERNGFLLELWIDPATVQIGDRVLAKVRVTNVGTDAPSWETNTCGNGPAPLEALASGGVDPGVQWDGHAARFKTQLLHAVGLEQRGPSRIGQFMQADMIDRGNVACPAFSAPKPFEPGQVEGETLAWDVVVPEGSAIPAGTAQLKATFELIDGPSVSTSASITIEDASIPELTVVDYIDAALAVPAFVDWMELHALTDRMDPGIAYWPNDDGDYPRMHPYENVGFPAAEVALFYPDNAEFGLVRSVVINRETLEVVGVRAE